MRSIIRFLPAAISVSLLAAISLPAADVLLIGPSPSGLFSDGGLAQYGHTVTIGPNYDVFDGTYDLSSFDVVVLSAVDYQLPVMPDSGQTRLVNFVAAGGGLITGEWLLWKNNFDILKPVFPSTTDGSYIGGAGVTVSVRYAQVTADPVLNAGLPASMDIVVNSAGSEIIVPKAGATVYYSGDAIVDPVNFPDAAPSAGLVGWNYGSGRVLNFSTTLQQPIGPAYTDNYSRLVANSITLAAQPVPEPSTMLLVIVAVVVLRFSPRLVRNPA